MKTILQYYPKFTVSRGGGPVHILNIVNNLSGYNFKLITNAAPGKPIVDTLGKNIKIQRFLPSDRNLLENFNPIVDRVLFPYNICSDLIREQNKRTYIRNEDFDLFHYHSGVISGNILKLALLLKRPTFVKNFEFSYIAQPKLMTFHGDFYKPLDNRVLATYQNALVDQFENIICVDKNLYSDMKNYVERTSQDKKVWFIPNSIDLHKFKFAPLPNKKKLRIGFIGRIEVSRGIELLYELIKKLPDYIDLYVIGAGNTVVLNKFKSNVDIAKIKFYENIKHEKIPDFLHKIDVLFNPITDEGISIISLEAMACGRPTIMINRGDRYPIINNKTGFLIDDKIDELFKLLEYLNDNRDAIQDASKNARKIVESEFSNKAIIPKIKNIYESLINS